MRLDKLVSFRPEMSANKLELPDKYKGEFTNIIYLSNTLFMAFDYCHTGVSTPILEDFMKAAGLEDRDYLIFGESLGYGWSDNGCKYLYAVALKKPLNQDIDTIASLMWMKWLRDNISNHLCLTDRYSHMYVGSIEYANSESDAKKTGYFGKPIYPCCVIESVRQQGGIYYKCYRYGEYKLLDKSQLIEWVKAEKVYNVSIGKKPLKNGSYRLNIRYL